MRHLIAIGFSLLLTIGCRPLATRTTRTPLVDASAQPTTEVTRLSSPLVKYEVSEESILQLVVMEHTLCQRIRTTPQRMIVREENELAGSDVAWSILSGVLGGTVVVAGIVNVAAPCELSDSPNCKEDEMSAVGGAMIGVGALLFLPLIVNGVRASDTERIERASPAVERIGRPEPCASEPMVDATVLVQVEKSKLGVESVTDDNGMVSLDLSELPWRPAFSGRQLVVEVNGKQVHRIPIQRVPAFVAFMEETKEEQVASARQAEAEVAARKKAAQVAEEELERKAPRIAMNDLLMDPDAFDNRLVRMRRVTLVKTSAGGLLQDDPPNNTLKLEIPSDASRELRQKWLCMEQGATFSNRDVWLVPRVQSGYIVVLLVRIEATVSTMACPNGEPLR